MKAFLALGTALGLLVLGSGCQENWQTFFIHDNKRLGSPPECQIPTAESSEALLSGTLDVGVTYGYAAYLFVENGLISREDPGLPRAESNGIFVQGAYLYYEPDPLCPGTYPDLEARLSAYVNPGGTYTVGMWVIPTSIGSLMQQTLATCDKGYLDVTVTIQFYGTTQAGTEVLTQEFDYPITVCEDCLVYCPVGVDADPLAAGCQCDCSSEVDQQEMPCHPGQDDLIDCRLVPPCN